MGGRRLPIREGAALTQVFRALERACGSQVEAAARVGLTPVQFWQRRHGRGGAQLTERVFVALANALGRAARERRGREAQRLKDAHRTLFRAVATPEGLRVLNERWQPWLFVAWKPWAPGSTRRRLSFSRTDERRYAVLELRRQLEARASQAIGRQLRRFDALIERHAKSGVRDKYRAELALYQALDPLLNGERTGGIERRSGDMTEKELARYLAAAYTCAAILLRPVGVLTRAVAL